MNQNILRSLESIQKSIAAVVAPNAQLAITNELLLDIRQLMMDQTEAELEGIPPRDRTRRIHPSYFTLADDYYRLNKTAFDKHGHLPINVLEISARAKNILAAIRVEYVYELRYYRRSDLMRVRNSGDVTLQEIDECLAKYKIYLPE